MQVGVFCDEFREKRLVICPRRSAEKDHFVHAHAGSQIC